MDTTTDRGIAPRYSRQQKLDWIDRMYQPHFDACTTVHEFRDLADDYGKALLSIGMSPTDRKCLDSVIDKSQFTYFRACPDSSGYEDGMTVNWCGLLLLFLWTFSMDPPGPIHAFWYNSIYYVAIVAAISACWQAWRDFDPIWSARSSGFKSKVYVDAIVSRHITLCPLAIVAFALEVGVALACLANAYCVQATLFFITAVVSGMSYLARRDHHRRIGL